jgi:hypothetical protein
MLSTRHIAPDGIEYYKSGIRFSDVMFKLRGSCLRVNRE